MLTLRQVVRWMQWPMAGLLVWAAFLQYNDPDPWLWVGIYGGAAVLSLFAFFRRLPRGLAFCFAAGAVGGCVFLALRVVGQQSLLQSEEGREMLGLLTVALWMLASVWWSGTSNPVNEQ